MVQWLVRAVTAREAPALVLYVLVGAIASVPYTRWRRSLLKRVAPAAWSRCGSPQTPAPSRGGGLRGCRDTTCNDRFGGAIQLARGVAV